MATIAVDTFLDGGVARTAGEAWTINSGAKLTIRTDTRVHANAPASMTGSLGTQTINWGEIFIDGRNVRWMAFNSGTGNVPAIGTTITQGAVSGYLLGVWATVLGAPTAVGAAMPTSGFLKFREVTNGPFSAGALSGIGASAVAADKTGWIEVVADQLSEIALTGLGKYTIRGDKFFLDNTNGSVGQLIDVPSNGGTGYPYGAFIETAPGSGEYDYWGVLRTANTWNYKDCAAPRGYTDKRQRFLKAAGDGRLQIGEDVNVTGTYAATATLSVTAMASWQVTSYIYYTDGYDCYVFYESGGFNTVKTGDTIHLDFTSGGLTAYDGYYVVTVLSAKLMKFTMPVSTDTRGALTIRYGINASCTAHGLQVGDRVYLKVLTGTGVTSGEYIVRYTGTNNLYFMYQHNGTLSGTATAHWGTTITTSAAHNMNIGAYLKCNFTSGTGVSGLYYIFTVPTTTTLTINLPFYGLTGGNVTLEFTIGHVPPAGCKVWIPNVILRQCTTAARATNALMHSTPASRPEFATTNTGIIDFEYHYGDWYHNFTQATSFNASNSVFGRLILSEIPNKPILNNCGIFDHLAASTKLTLSYLPAGAELNDVSVMMDYITGTNVSAVDVSYSDNVIFNNCEFFHSGQYPGLSTYALYPTMTNNLEMNNCISVGFIRAIYIVSGNYIKVRNIDYSQRISGASYAGAYVASGAAVCEGTLIDGITIGFGGTIPFCAPTSGLVYLIGKNEKVRNIGAEGSPLLLDGFRPSLYHTNTLVDLGLSSLRGLKIQRCYLNSLRSIPLLTSNVHKDILMSEVFVDYPALINNAAGTFTGNASNDFTVIAVQANGVLNTSGASSTYGNHFTELFNGTDWGEYGLFFQSPSAKSASQVEKISGNPLFTNAGTLYLRTSGDQIIITDAQFRKGHTAFRPLRPYIAGITAASHLIEYQIDTGSGFTGVWRNLYNTRTLTYSSASYYINDVDTATLQVGDYLWGTELKVGTKIVSKNGNIVTLNKLPIASNSATINAFYLPNEVIDPAVGFRLKIRCTALITNTDSMTAIHMFTATTDAAKYAVSYPLDTNTITFTGLPTGCDMVVLEAGTTNVLDQKDAVAATSIGYTYSGEDVVDVGFIKPGYIPYYIRGLSLGLTDTSVPVMLTIDRNYAA